MVANVLKAVVPKGAQSTDPFWDITAGMLLSALIFYLLEKAPEDEQNFEMVLEMLHEAKISEESNKQNVLDILFERLEMENPNHIALQYYKAYHSGAEKTLQSINVTLESKLEKFIQESMARLTSTDELDLRSLGEKKTALYAIIPDDDTSVSFFISILYTQLFQELFYLADTKYKGALPIPVHFIMDEFANVTLPDDFDKILSVMRSRNISASIILQNLAQLKSLFDKQWESILGNCDTFLYLGGNESSTFEYISKLLGKETLNINTHSKSLGRSGNFSTNYQTIGRELLTPDEVRLLDNRYALLFIRGEKPIIDEKFDIMKHKNVKISSVGKGKPYEIDSPKYADVTLKFNTEDLLEMKENDFKEIQEVSSEYELLSNDELEDYLIELEKNNEEKGNKKNE